jgi:Leucine-rich repeat (LRR) protein
MISNSLTVELIEFGYNKIRSIESRAFYNLTKPFSLFLNNNEIESIENESFSLLPALSTLDQAKLFVVIVVVV